MANKRANARAKVSKMNHSWPWVIVRVLQIAICVVVVGLSIYLRFTYKPSTLIRRDLIDDSDSNSNSDDKEDKKEYTTPPWLAPTKTPVNTGDDQFYNPVHGKWGFSPLVSLIILIIVVSNSLQGTSVRRETDDGFCVES